MKKTPIFVHPGDVARQAGSGVNEDSLKDRIIDIALRAENNLIILDENNELYTDLQLEDGISTSDDLPVGVETGRVLVADGRPVNGTLILAKTTSGDEIQLLYGDDGKIYADNGTGTFKTLGWTTAYFKTQAEYDALPQSKESDNNLYIIVDAHITLLSYEQLMALGTSEAIVTELNKAPRDYGAKYDGEGHIIQYDINGNLYPALSPDGEFPEILTGGYVIIFYDGEWEAGIPPK